MHHFNGTGCAYLMVVICHVFVSAIAAYPGTKTSPTEIRMAFVNDGCIVLVGADGAMTTSGISGIGPLLSADGRELVYTGIQKTERVHSALPQYSRYGTTYALTGAYRWNLETGVREKLSGGWQVVDISPGHRVIVTKDETLYVVGQPDEKLEEVDKAEHAVWVGDSNILYEKAFQMWWYDLKTKSRSVLAKSPGTILRDDLAEDPSRFLKAILSGKTLSCQQCLCSFAGGTKAAFVQFEGSLKHEKHSLVYVDATPNMLSCPLVSVQGAELRLGPILQVAVSQDQSKVAFARQDKLRKTEAVFVAKLPDSNRVIVGATGITRVCEYSSVDQLAFWDSDTLLVCVIDKTKTHIPLPGGATLVIGARQLEPAQIEMMGLSKSICEADKIYRVDLKTKEQRLLSSGHDMTVK